jgi:hypothetical protein
MKKQKIGEFLTGKVVPVLNEEHHEDIWDSGETAPWILHVLVILPTVPIGQEAGLLPQVWTLWRRVKSLCLSEIKSLFTGQPACNLVSILIAVFRLL